MRFILVSRAHVLWVVEHKAPINKELLGEGNDVGEEVAIALEAKFLLNQNGRLEPNFLFEVDFGR